MRKAARSDNIPGRVLRTCANQLLDVILGIFNISLSQEPHSLNTEAAPYSGSLALDTCVSLWS